MLWHVIFVLTTFVAFTFLRTWKFTTRAPKKLHPFFSSPLGCTPWNTFARGPKVALMPLDEV